MSERKPGGWRVKRAATAPIIPGERPDGELIPATRFFDNLSFIGNEWVGCFVLETDAGLIQIDCMEPGEKYDRILRDGYEALGLDLSDLKAILITHGHGDHFGNAGALRAAYGCKIYMSSIDETFANTPPAGKMPYPPMGFEADGYLEDMTVFSLGGTEVLSVFTPGHTPGCLSFILPVTDEGRPHKAALWGGTGLPGDRAGRLQYLESCDHFAAVCAAEKVDVEISTHPFVDNTKERLALCRCLVDGVANPFVIGADAAARYQDTFRQTCVERL